MPSPSISKLPPSFSLEFRIPSLSESRSEALTIPSPSESSLATSLAAFEGSGEAQDSAGVVITTL